jgi:crotonobetainyl-CoA:carnitine CoA-transferase CaiB-like acyl-CoA transferase
VRPLAGHLVVDFTRYLPGPFASRELLRLGARVVRVEPPAGDPLREAAPAWDAVLNAGKESVVCDLKAEPALAQGLCDRADVILDGFRPGVLERLGLRAPERAVWCAITGFGPHGPHARRAGHDVNYLGWAGALADTAPAPAPLPVADLAAGGLSAALEILAALLERGRTGRGSRLEISMTHGAHRLVSYRLGGDPLPRFLTGGLACYRLYPTADGRSLTVGALEPKFFARLCELLERPELAGRQYDSDQDALAAELGAIFAARPLAAWLQLCEGEDVCVGPVLTIDEAATELGGDPGEGGPGAAQAHAAALGEHTDLWRGELGP